MTANVTDGGKLSYQWYRNSDGSTSGGTMVGTDSPSYTPDISAAGTYYYYCVITNTNSAAYYPTATSVTDAVCIEVTIEGHTHAPILIAGQGPTCQTDGSKAYYLCDCGLAFEDEACTKLIADVESWKVIPALEHDFKDGKCALCGAPDPDYDPAAGEGDDPGKDPGDDADPAITGDDGSKNGNDSKTGDDSHLVLWLAVLLIAGGGSAGALIVRRIRRKQS